MGTEPDIQEVLRRAKEGIRRLEPKVPKSRKKKKILEAPAELWPGEHMDLGGWTLAKGKRKTIKKLAGGERYG